MLSRQDPRYLADSQNLMFFSLFQFSLFLSGFHDSLWLFGLFGIFGQAMGIFLSLLVISGPNRHVPLEDFSVLRQKTRIRTNNLLSLF